MACPATAVAVGARPAAAAVAGAWHPEIAVADITKDMGKDTHERAGRGRREKDETKRNEAKRNETKRNKRETKRNET